jgi:hypothetical protein
VIGKEIIDTLSALAQRGKLDPVAVVEAARPESSPLHDRFTWDDSEAAHQFRLIEARKLIQVCVELLPGAADPSPVWVSLRQDRPHGGGYRRMVTVLSDEDLRAQLLDDALEAMEYFQQKYGALKELARVFDEMKKVKRKK